MDKIRSHVPLEKQAVQGTGVPFRALRGRLVQNSPLPPRAQHPGPSRLGGPSPCSSRVGKGQ